MVCGAGFIGLEVAENLRAQGLEVTVIDAAAQIMPNAYDEEMADYAKKQLKAAGMRVLTSTGLKGIEGTDKAEKVITDNGALAAECCSFWQLACVRPQIFYLIPGLR